jgi:hypothetical protein
MTYQKGEKIILLGVIRRKFRDAHAVSGAQSHVVSNHITKGNV